MTPSEMQALTEPWRPYRSIGKPTFYWGEVDSRQRDWRFSCTGVYYMWRLAEEKASPWNKLVYIKAKKSLCHPKMLVRANSNSLTKSESLFCCHIPQQSVTFISSSYNIRKLILVSSAGNFLQVAFGLHIPNPTAVKYPLDYANYDPYLRVFTWIAAVVVVPSICR